MDGYIILKSVFLPNTWAGQQYQYLKHGGYNPVANKKMTLGKVVTNFTGQVVTSWVCVCVRVCVLQHNSRIHHTSPEIMHFYVYIKSKCLSFLKYFRPIKLFCRTLCFLILPRIRLNY